MGYVKLSSQAHGVLRLIEPVADSFSFLSMYLVRPCTSSQEITTAISKSASEGIPSTPAPRLCSQSSHEHSLHGLPSPPSRSTHPAFPCSTYSSPLFLSLRALCNKSHHQHNRLPHCRSLSLRSNDYRLLRRCSRNRLGFSPRQFTPRSLLDGHQVAVVLRVKGVHAALR